MERRGDWMQTYTGRRFWPLDPQPEDVCIEDIAHSLALQCRFAGHCRVPYSVAEHSVRVTWAVRGAGHPTSTLLAALLHDASEAYLVDLPRPVKRHISDYRQAEGWVMAAICERFGVVWENNLPVWEVVKHADNVLHATEARDIMGPPPVPWEALPAPLPDMILPWHWQEAETLFLCEFRLLTEGRP